MRLIIFALPLAFVLGSPVLAAGPVDDTIPMSQIDLIDREGPRLNSIIALNPDREKIAAALEAEKAAGNLRSAIHGYPVLIKDNIETADNMTTTAGSLALADNVTHPWSPDCVPRAR